MNPRATSVSSTARPIRAGACGHARTRGWNAALLALGGLFHLLALAGPAERAHAQAAEPSSASSAAATEDANAEATERFADAERLYAAGDFSGAASALLRVYALLEGQPTQYIVRFSLGQAYEGLHRYDLAIEQYERYLAEAGDAAEDRADVEASLRALERLLGAIEVSFEGDDAPARAEVWAGDWQIGEAPGVVRAPGGTLALELRAPGHETVRRSVEVTARAHTTLRVSMPRLAEFHGLSPALFATSTAVAAVALGVGVGFGASALARSNEAAACPSAPVCTLDPEAARRAIRDDALAADVLYGVAGLFGVTSVVLAFVTDFGGEAPASSGAVAWRVSPVAAPNHVGVVASGEF